MTASTKKLDLATLPCTRLHGVGDRVAEKLQRLSIHTVQDLLFHLPFRYQDRTHITPMNQLQIGDYAVVEGEIQEIALPKVGKTRLLCRLMGPVGFVTLRFFHVNPFQRQQLREGVRLRCFSEVRYGPKGFEMAHPEYQIITAQTPLPVQQTLTPIYPVTEGLSQLMLRKLTDRALEFLQHSEVEEIMPPSILQQFSFPTLKEALQFIHRPPVKTPVALLSEGKHPFQQRLVFEELLAHRLSLLRLKKSIQIFNAAPLQTKNNLSEQFVKQLAFTLTAAQQRVTQEIQQDLAKPHPMLRLVQGDVGSGKTVVAALAILQAIENGYQSAVLAPTEILTEQHYRNFQQWLAPLGIKIVLLSGHLKTTERREALAAIADGSAAVIIGTHAIFQKEVVFARLALMVVDEQHRFGVEQRALLREKGLQGGCYPHQLIMTATPIPRTLTMSAYADLDCSVIDELPPGRTPITTSVVANTRRDEILARIQERCHQGHQVYWVCTLIEESELLQCQATQETEKQLRAALPDLNIGLIHGRMRSAEKESIMANFKKGETHLLIATTVIEVGVDVPNASLMVIENAERLGLAQLHQLRGRVGRGTSASHCVLMYQTPLSLLAKQRLAVMRETNDGFKIAQRDLELRGPGEVLGTKQAGDMTLRVADLLRDSELLPNVQQAATIILEQFADRVPLLIKRWLGHNEQYGHV